MPPETESPSLFSAILHECDLTAFVENRQTA
jgi:hypothetical protein